MNQLEENNFYSLPLKHIGDFQWLRRTKHYAGILLAFLFLSCSGQQQAQWSKDGVMDSNRAAVKSSLGEVVAEMDTSLTCVFQDSRDNYWFAGGKRGVFKYDGKSLVLFSKKDGLCSNAILGIQEDKSGNLYFDTQEGVSQFDGQQFTTLEVIENPATKNEWKLAPDDLWFRMGWNKNGPYRYDGESLYHLTFPKTEQADKFYAAYPNASFNPYGIYSLYRDSKGMVWMGTSSLGVCRYDGETISWLYEEQMTTTPGGGALGIRSTLEDKAGYFWFTHTRYRYAILAGNSDRNGSTYINYKKEKGVGFTQENGEMDFPYFMSIAEDNEGDLWMVTYDDGVWRNKGEELIHYPIKDGEKAVLLFSIYQDQQGILWLGTHNAGVYKYNGSNFERFEP